MQKAVAVLRKVSADEKELFEIEQREKAIRDEISARTYERRQGAESIIAKMKKSGMSDEQIQKILAIN